jgi:hypothetical protein
MFGGFDLTSGFNSLSDIGDKLQKLKEDVETQIDATFANAEQESIAVEQGEKAGPSQGRCTINKSKIITSLQSATAMSVCMLLCDS